MGAIEAETRIKAPVKRARHLHLIRGPELELELETSRPDQLIREISGTGTLRLHRNGRPEAESEFFEQAATSYRSISQAPQYFRGVDIRMVKEPGICAARGVEDGIAQVEISSDLLKYVERGEPVLQNEFRTALLLLTHDEVNPYARRFWVRAPEGPFQRPSTVREGIGSLQKMVGRMFPHEIARATYFAHERNEGKGAPKHYELVAREQTKQLSANLEKLSLEDLTTESLGRELDPSRIESIRSRLKVSAEAIGGHVYHHLVKHGLEPEAIIRMSPRSLLNAYVLSSSADARPVISYDSGNGSLDMARLRTQMNKLQAYAQAHRQQLRLL